MPWNSELAMPPSPSESDLTPLRTHCLKKSRIQLQFARKFALITSQGSSVNVSTLSYLGRPFSPPPRDAPPVDLPSLRYIFCQFVLTFPFMAATPPSSRNLSSTSVFNDTDTEQILCGATKLLGLDRLDLLSEKCQARLAKTRIYLK
jgi:putative phosphoinositide-binding PX family protein